MKKLLFACLIVLALALPSQSWATAAACSGAVCYVDSSSTGTGDGTTTATTGAQAAFKTIAEVNALTYAQDTQILFNRGQTWRETLTVPSSGSSGHPITFGAYGSGAQPIISGANLVTGWSSSGGNLYTKALATAPGVVVFGSVLGNNVQNVGSLAANGDWVHATGTLSIYRTTAPDTEFPSGVEVGQRDNAINTYLISYFTIQDITIKNTSLDAIRISTANNIILQRLNISNAGGAYGRGIAFLAVTNSTIQNNTISYVSNHMNLEGASNNNIVQYNDMSHSQIMVYGGGVQGLQTQDSTGNIIRYNYIHDARPWPTASDDRQGDGIFLHGASNSNQVYYNVVYQTNDGIDIFGNSNLIYNNAIYKCRYQSIGFNNEGPGSGDLNIVKNNILDTAEVNHIVLISRSSGTANVIDNNVLYDPAGASICWQGSNENWGCITFAQWQAHNKYDMHSVSTDPLFVSTFTPDFHLQAGSTAINHGVDVGLTTDYAGNPIRGLPDIGAYESSGVIRVAGGRLMPGLPNVVGGAPTYFLELSGGTDKLMLSGTTDRVLTTH